MKVIKSWYGVLPAYAAMSLFFGILGIHLGLGWYFGIDTTGLPHMHDGFYISATVFLLAMSLVMCPLLYWLVISDGAKYVEKVEIKIENLHIMKYDNMWIISAKKVLPNSRYAWVLKKSPFGYDIEKHGYFTFYNYYYSNKKFKEVVLNESFIKGIL